MEIMSEPQGYLGDGENSLDRGREVRQCLLALSNSKETDVTGAERSKTEKDGRNQVKVLENKDFDFYPG